MKKDETKREIRMNKTRVRGEVKREQGELREGTGIIKK